MKKLLIATATLIGALNLSGCMLVMEGSDYHGDHGDLVSSDGAIRYVGWCEVHPHNSHCLDTQNGNTVAIHPGAVALNSDEASADLADSTSTPE
jgi:hypothetical protein